MISVIPTGIGLRITEICEKIPKISGFAKIFGKPPVLIVDNTSEIFLKFKILFHATFVERCLMLKSAEDINETCKNFIEEITTTTAKEVEGSVYSLFCNERLKQTNAALFQNEFGILSEELDEKKEKDFFHYC
ncbi:hypothetical protein HDU92_006983 [Lobulomyces angularis]|nr:hypothetical protein HDU92_006983 [Lobulomyces angularis]